MSSASAPSQNPLEDARHSDVILSSGFLAFASHAGFLLGVERSRVTVSALVGTSSGALVGALYSAGHELHDIAKMLTAAPPLRFLRLHVRPWEGAFDAAPLRRFLEQHLPSSFDALRWPFAVGVAALDTSRHQLLTDGPLVSAVLASCAVPRLIRPVNIAGRRFADGGAVDRLGLAAWREWRPAAAGVLHRVERSMGNERREELDGVLEVNSPRSRNSLLALRNFDDQLVAACERTQAALCGVAAP